MSCVDQSLAEKIIEFGFADSFRTVSCYISNLSRFLLCYQFDDYSRYKLAVSIRKAMDKSSGIPSICRQILLAAIFLMRTSSSRANPELYWKPLISAVIARSCLNARHLFATVVLTGAIIAANSRSWIQMRS